MCCCIVCWQSWYSKTPMGKRRARAAKAFQEAAELKKGKKKQEKKTGKFFKMAAETNEEKKKK